MLLHFFAALLILAASCAQADVYLNNLTCDDSAGRVCGNGICLPATGTCLCGQYWSTASDFVVMDGDCSTNEIGIYVLWAVNLAALFWSYFQSTAVILARFDIYRETKKIRKGYGLWQNKGLLGIFCYYGLSTPFHAIMSVLHFVQPTTRVGFDLLATLCFFFGKLGFYVMIVLVQGSMLAAALRGNKAEKQLVRWNYVFQIVVNTTSVAVGSLAFVTLTLLQGDHQQSEQIALMQAYYIVQSLALFGQGVGATIIMVKVNKALNVGKDLVVSPKNGNNNTAPSDNTSAQMAGSQPTQQNRTETIRGKVNDLQRTSMRQAAFQGIVYLLMGTIPFFINKHQYFLPISWLAMPVIGKKLAHQFIADPNSKTVLARLGLKKQSQNGTSGKNAIIDGVPSLMSGAVVLQDPRQTNLNTAIFSSENPLMRQESIVVGAAANGRKTRIGNQSSFASSDGGQAFEDLLDPQHALHGKFVAFVHSRHAENEVSLLSFTIKYKQCGDSKERAKMGKMMIKDYVEPGAGKQVDLPHEMRDIVLSTAKRNQFVATTFDQIRRTLAFDLKGNFLASFEKQMARESDLGGK